MKDEIRKVVKALDKKHPGLVVTKVVDYDNSYYIVEAPESTDEPDMNDPWYAVDKDTLKVFTFTPTADLPKFSKALNSNVVYDITRDGADTFEEAVEHFLQSDKADVLIHHGILGMKWGHKNGPPYPLDESDHSASEKKAGWKQSLSGDDNSFNSRLRRRENRIDKSIDRAEAKGKTERVDKLSGKRSETSDRKDLLSKDLTPEEIEYGKRIYENNIAFMGSYLIGGVPGAGVNAIARLATGRAEEDRQAYKDAKTAYAKKTNDYKTLVKNSEMFDNGMLNVSAADNMSKVADKLLSKEQKDRLVEARSRVDKAHQREEGSKDPAIEKERDSWAEKQARAAVQRELDNPRSTLRGESERTIEKTVESYKYDKYLDEWDNNHPEYSRRNSREESSDAAFENYKNVVNDVSRELLGDRASQRDIERSYYGLDQWVDDANRRK